MQINILSSAIVTAYLLGCGSLYLWGFWLHFDLNILQFVEISDIVKATLLPMLTSLFLFLFQCGINHINNPTSSNSKGLMKAGGGYKYVVYLQYGLLALMLVSGLYGLGYRFFCGTKAEKYLCIGVITALVVCFLTYKSKFLLDLGRYRAFMLFLICTLPLIFMNKGILDAKDILSGKNTFLVESNVSCSPNKEQKFRYISTLSSNGFAYSPSDNSLCVFKYEYMKLSKEPQIPEKTIGWLNRANQAIVEFFGG